MEKTYAQIAAEIAGPNVYVTQPKDGAPIVKMVGGPDGIPVSAEIQAQIDTEFAKPAAVTSADVNAETARRTQDTFVFNGNPFDNDDKAKSRITGAAALAGFAIGAGATVGNLRWHGGSSDFGWITKDNTVVTMDAPTVFAFGQAAANWESIHVFAGRALKDMSPIPEDYQDDKYWP